MGAKVILKVTSGELSGEQFEFEEHDTFLFGRQKRDCQACLTIDPKVSRHHFLLEVIPPAARLRDLGSRNGTIVNGKMYGKRELHETPEEGKRKQHPEVDLKDGDVVQVGDTSMQFEVELPVVELGEEDMIDVPAGNHPPTLKRTPTAIQPIVACQQCGENVADEAGPGRTGDYICNACRDSLSSDPMRHLRALIHQAGKGQTSDSIPEIPGHRVGEKLGDGGMGVVYKAQRPEDAQDVAVKLMLSRIAVDPSARNSFLRECQVLGTLQHPNVVQLISSDAVGSAFYFVMEYCNGGCFSKQLRRGRRLSWRKIGPLMVQALEGLAYAHEKGYVHRDIKPQNILLDRRNKKLTAKIADFGLAKNFEKAGLSGFTKTGSFAGTSRFMPREQLTNYKYVQPVSDIWSFGATLYNLLTGDYPRDYPSGCDEYDAILEGRMVPVRQRAPQISKHLAEVVDRAVADDPSDRFQSARDLQKALKEVIEAS